MKKNKHTTLFASISKKIFYLGILLMVFLSIQNQNKIYASVPINSDLPIDMNTYITNRDLVSSEGLIISIGSSRGHVELYKKGQNFWYDTKIGNITSNIGWTYQLTDTAIRASYSVGSNSYNIFFSVGNTLGAVLNGSDSVSFSDYFILPDIIRWFYQEQAPSIIVDGINNNGRTKNGIVHGKALANSYVRLYDNQNAMFDSKYADLSGNWSCTFTENKTYTIRATSTLNDYTSPISSPVTFTLDTVTSKPTITPLQQSIGNSFPTLSGSAEANSIVTIYDGDFILGTAIAANDGTWTNPLTNLLQGAHTFKVKASDVLGNISDFSDPVTYTYDNIAPSAPAINSIFQYVLLNLPIELQGTAEAGSTISLYLNGSNTAIGTATTNNFGIWIFNFPNNITWGSGVQTITAKATDTVGNTSDSSTALNFVLAPTAAEVATELLNTNTFINDIEARFLSNSTFLDNIANKLANNSPFITSVFQNMIADQSTLQALLGDLAVKSIGYAALYNAVRESLQPADQAKATAAFNAGVAASNLSNATNDTIMAAIRTALQ